MDVRRMDEAGRHLRRVPGARHALDFRLALLRKRHERATARREAALDERDRVWAASVGLGQPVRLNIGSSGEHIDAWINADLYRDASGETFRMDAMYPVRPLRTRMAATQPRL